MTSNFPALGTMSLATRMSPRYGSAPTTHGRHRLLGQTGDMTAQGARRGNPAHPSGSGSSASHIARLSRTVWAWVRSAPGTYIWYLVLAVNTIVLLQMSPAFRHHFLVDHSTNLANLSHDPLRVLVVSALWTDSPRPLYYLAVFTLFLAIAERWLGTLRWFAVVVAGHIGATLLTAGGIAVAIEMGLAPRSLRHVVDVGVSYGFAAVAGVLTFYLARGMWRWAYLAAGLTLTIAAVAATGSFTSVGHLSAFCIGLAMYPMTRGRPRWDPTVTARRLRARRQARPASVQMTP
jgi:hypothetical protein